MGLPFNIFDIGAGKKNCLGVDIGTLSIKIVELSSEDGRPKLENYASLTNYGLASENKKTFGGEAGLMLRRLIKESGIKANEVNMSVPIFSSFLTVMELPKMSEAEVASAIQFEAKKYVPVPLESVVVDWSLIGEEAGLPAQPGKILVLLVAIPRDLINEYTAIARDAGLKLLTIELETVSAARALIGNDPIPTILLDMGSRDTTISLVDSGHLRISHSIETSGEDLTRALAAGLNINWRRAEEIKKETGLKVINENGQIAGIITPLLDSIINPTQNIMDDNFSKTKKKIEKLMIYGGASKMPGFADYLSGRLKINVMPGNPFNRIAYPEKLKPIINAIGHEFTVAAGLALKALQ
ncbi:MAG: type IV pilus assembly protein PilM [Candidatus Azambacteria bacterium]|nr:type IV pilus assembly protein PilM [Candidatus Azambacteria bacterium]